MYVHNHPSDLQLFLFWALTEYLFFTRDFAFLERFTPYYGQEDRKATIREKVMQALAYFYQNIGLGEHGLVRCGDGDWSDGITLFVKHRLKFIRAGESVFNSAMALYVLPRLADLIARWDAPAADQARQYTAALRQAVLRCFNGRWFYRAFDGSGKPLGDQELFLEQHTWLLISQALPEEQARSVVQSIVEILDEPSRYGQYVLYPPQHTTLGLNKPGWDVNGGVWYAMNYLLTWGYSYYDPALAWRSLVKNSLAYKATLDPHLWYGIWSGPDSFNADYAERPNETYYTLYTPSTDFPVMNLNLHAGFLLALIKLCGIEPASTGTLAAPRLPWKDFSLHLPTFKLDMEDGLCQFMLSDTYNQVSSH